MLGSPSPSRLRGPSTWLACAALLLAVLALASCGATSKTAGDTSTNIQHAWHVRGLHAVHRARVG